MTKYSEGLHRCLKHIVSIHKRLLRKKHKKWEKQPVEGDEHQ